MQEDGELASTGQGMETAQLSFLDPTSINESSGQILRAVKGIGLQCRTVICKAGMAMEIREERYLRLFQSETSAVDTHRNI